MRWLGNGQLEVNGQILRLENIVDDPIRGSVGYSAAALAAGNETSAAVRQTDRRFGNLSQDNRLAEGESAICYALGVGWYPTTAYAGRDEIGIIQDSEAIDRIFTVEFQIAGRPIFTDPLRMHPMPFGLQVQGVGFTGVAADTRWVINNGVPHGSWRMWEAEQEIAVGQAFDVVFTSKEAYTFLNAWRVHFALGAVRGKPVN